MKRIQTLFPSNLEKSNPVYFTISYFKDYTYI